MVTVVDIQHRLYPLGLRVFRPGQQQVKGRSLVESDTGGSPTRAWQEPLGVPALVQG
jgi:hypothetical protein